jgi:hypothetical protein
LVQRALADSVLQVLLSLIDQTGGIEAAQISFS